jgi:type II secretory pathway component PulF
MNETKRPLLLSWVHTIIVAIILAVPTYIVPRWVHARIDLHGDLPESAILKSLLGFVEWVQRNLILTLVILGVYSLNAFVCGKLKSTRSRAMYTTIVALVTAVFMGVLLYVCKKEISS